jgi:hypothetical protein
MERSRRLVMGALLVAMVPALLASSPATAAEHDGSDERAAARLDATVNAPSRAARLRATIDADWDVSQPTGEKIEKILFAAPGVATSSLSTGATPEKKER